MSSHLRLVGAPPGDSLRLFDEPEQLQLAHLVQGFEDRDSFYGLFLKNRRSPATSRSYDSCLRAFFAWLGSRTAPVPRRPSDIEILNFLALPAPELHAHLQTYKNRLIELRKSEATLNSHLAAIKSLMKFGFRSGKCCCDGRSLVDGERVVPYRQTRGIGPEAPVSLLALPARLHAAEPMRAARDRAMLLLLVENLLRRAELRKLNVGDYLPRRQPRPAVRILGKGRGTASEEVSISPDSVEAIDTYLCLLGEAKGLPIAPTRSMDGGGEVPLFQSGHQGRAGQRLTDMGIFWLIRGYGAAIGIEDLAPHMLRHTGITNLRAAGVPPEVVQKLSRHKKAETMARYDHNMRDDAGDAMMKLHEMYQPGAR